MSDIHSTGGPDEPPATDGYCSTCGPIVTAEHVGKHDEPEVIIIDDPVKFHHTAFAAPANPTYDLFRRNDFSIFSEIYVPPSEAERVETLTAALQQRETIARAARHANLTKDYNRLMRKLERALGDILVKQHLEAADE